MYIYSNGNTSLIQSYASVLDYGIVEGLDADPEKNKKNLQKMIKDCGSKKAICFPCGDFVFNPGIDLGEEQNITMIGFSSSFGSFMQKNIYTGKIVDTFTRIVCAKNTFENFFKHKSCILILDKLAFYNIDKNEKGEFDFDKEAKTNTLLQHTRSEGAGKNTEKGKVFCTECAFFGWKVVFGSEFTMQHLENEWGTQLNSDDYEYFKQSCPVASRCRFTRNGVAINQPVDARIIDCSFNKNDYAIVFREDSGLSTISNCRIEWNIHNGIYIEKAHDITMSNCEFDCNGRAGLYAVENTSSNFTNCIFRRNGAQVPIAEDDSHKNDYVNNVHVYANGNINCNFIGFNTVAKPTLDTGSAPEKPSNCSCFIQNDSCIIALNNLQGCTKGNKIDANQMTDNINCVIENNIIADANDVQQ